MSLNLKIGNRISFRYTAGTHPNAERDLVITSLDSENVRGFDFSVEVNGERIGAYRNFNRSKMNNIYCLHKDWLTEECKNANEILKRFLSVETSDLVRDLNVKFGNIFVADGREVKWKQEKKDKFSFQHAAFNIETKEGNKYQIYHYIDDVYFKRNGEPSKKVESLSHLLDLLGHIPF